MNNCIFNIKQHMLFLETFTFISNRIFLIPPNKSFVKYFAWKLGNDIQLFSFSMFWGHYKNLAKRKWTLKQTSPISPNTTNKLRHQNGSVALKVQSPLPQFRVWQWTYCLVPSLLSQLWPTGQETVFLCFKRKKSPSWRTNNLTPTHPLRR